MAQLAEPGSNKPTAGFDPARHRKKIFFFLINYLIIYNGILMVFYMGKKIKNKKIYKWGT